MTENLLAKSLEENYKYLHDRFLNAVSKSGRDEQDVIFLAATKTQTPELINRAVKLGVSYIGENRVQEFLSKDEFITANVHKHFIGHLQTNKVRDIVGRVEMIQSVHSLKLAKEISACSIKRGIVSDILLEINIGNEESKSGFSYEEATEKLHEISLLSGIRVKGLMSIPPICEKNSEIYTYFTKMNKLFIDIKAKKMDNVNMDILSMGMSGDFEAAIECGSNLVRVGTALFGERPKKI